MCTVRPSHDLGAERRPDLTWATEYTGGAVTSKVTTMATIDTTAARTTPLHTTACLSIFARSFHKRPYPGLSVLFRPWPTCNRSLHVQRYDSRQEALACLGAVV